MLGSRKGIVLIGGGGHCVSVIDIIESGSEFNITGILDSNKKETNILGHRVLGSDELIPDLVKEGNYLLITVGQIKSYSARLNIANNLLANNAKIATITSPLAYVSRHAVIGEGTIIMHHAVINAQSKIGNNCIINSKSNIEHGVIVEDFCHVSTCAVVNGDTVVGRGSFIGSNATISNGISIKENSIISAGAFVSK